MRTGEDGRRTDLLCRLGGDEFAVLLQDVDETTTRLVADRILTVVQEPIVLPEGDVAVSATIGVALAHHNHHPDAVVRHADVAMYQAKEAGRGRYAIFVS